MIINTKDFIAGHPSLKIRDLFKKLECCHFSTSYVAKKMNISETATKKMFSSLLKLKYIKKTECKGYWQLTETGLRLSQAKASYIKRSTADKCVEEMLQNVDKVNKDDSLDFYILYVLVFGSYLGDSSFVGDVDISIEIWKKDLSLSYCYCSKLYDPDKGVKKSDPFSALSDWKNFLALKIRCNKKLEFHSFGDVVISDKFSFLYLDHRMDEQKLRKNINDLKETYKTHEGTMLFL